MKAKNSVQLYKLLLFYTSCRETVMRRKFYPYTDTSPSLTHQSYLNEGLFNLLFVVHYVTASPKSAAIRCTPKISRVDLCYPSQN